VSIPRSCSSPAIPLQGRYALSANVLDDWTQPRGEGIGIGDDDFPERLTALSRPPEGGSTVRIAELHAAVFGVRQRLLFSAC